MRATKSILISLIALLALLAVTYFTRNSLLSVLINKELNTFQSKVTCVGLNFTDNLNIQINKLCLENSIANATLKNITIRWQLFPTPQISYINIEQAIIRGQAHLLANTNQNKSTENKSLSFNQRLSQLLSPYLKQLKQLPLPMSANIEQFTYWPYNEKVNAIEPHSSSNRRLLSPYSGALSIKEQQFTFTLFHTTPAVMAAPNIIDAKLIINNDQANFTLQAHLTPLQKFMTAHQLPLPNDMKAVIMGTKIAGQINIQASYQHEMLTISSTTENVNITSSKGIKNSGAFSVKGTVALQVEIPLQEQLAVKDRGTQIKLTLAQQSELVISYDHAQLISTLEQRNIDSSLITVLKDNPISHLTITPKSNNPNGLMIVIDGTQMHLNGLALNAETAALKQQLIISDVSAEIPFSGNKMAIGHINLNSSITISNLNALTTAPVSINLVGSLNRTATQTNIKLFENSFITLDKLSAPTQQGKSTKTNSAYSLKALTSNLSGQLQLDQLSKLNLNLHIHTQASQLNIPDIMQLKAVNVTGNIKGAIDDIDITARVNADQVNLADITIKGAISSASLKLSANNLPLTDLLSLNIKLPKEVALIDGSLDYYVSGTHIDLANVTNSSLDAEVAIHSLSGEIDNIWLQELNWQQKFSVNAGKINSLPPQKDNLTIALIETPTPITALSLQSQFNYNDKLYLSLSHLNASALGGSFSIANAKWPIEKDHSVNVQLSNIDLEQILALDKKQGIVVTGHISGHLPITYDGEKYLIAQGNLHNVTNGLIQVIDNPAVNELKANNSQLKLAFDALQNLHYHQLYSEVSMADDGYMLLETVIEGRNPDIDNDVNLNLNLSYDLLGLLESLSITAKFEEKIIQGIQTH